LTLSTSRRDYALLACIWTVQRATGHLQSEAHCTSSLFALEELSLNRGDSWC